jgi:hypothetical protein
LAIAVVALTLTLGIAQNLDRMPDISIALIRIENHWEHLLTMFGVWTPLTIRDRIRQSNPKVYIDDQLAGPLQYGPAASMNVEVPGDGVYSFVSPDEGAPGWTEGRIHGNTIEFEAGSRHVRIECNRSIVPDRPVFARRQTPVKD